jgi:hypothetical protein
MIGDAEWGYAGPYRNIVVDVSLEAGILLGPAQLFWRLAVIMLDL